MKSFISITTIMGLMLITLSFAEANSTSCPKLNDAKLLASCDQIVENWNSSVTTSPTSEAAFCIYSGQDDLSPKLIVKGSYIDIIPASVYYPERRILNQVDSFLENNVPTDVEYKVSVSIENDHSITASAIKQGGDFGVYDQYKRVQKFSSDKKFFTETNFWRGGRFSLWDPISKFSLKCSQSNN